MNSNILLDKIESQLDEFPRSETRFARWVLKFPEEAAQLGIQELAEKSGSSEPSIVRFSKRLGCTGFREFKAKLLISLQKKPLSEAPPQDPFLADQLLFRKQWQRLQDQILKSLPSQDLKQFLNKLMEARQVLILADPSLKEVSDLVFRQLLPFNKRLQVCAREDQSSGMLGRLGKSDVLLFLHYGNAHLLKAVTAVKSKKVFVAAFGHFPLEAGVDVFFGSPENSSCVELSILLSLAQIVNLLPKHVEEARKNAETFYVLPDQAGNAETLKPLQGEFWSQETFAFNT